MVGHAGSSVCIAHVDMTLTWSKVKVTDLLKFRKLHFSTLTSPEFTAFYLHAGRGYNFVIVIADRPKQAVHAGGDDHQPPCGAFYCCFSFICD